MDLLQKLINYPFVQTSNNDYYLNRSLKSQFNTADKLNSKYIIILNSDDLKTYEVKVKDNKTKEEEKISINDLVDYLDMHMQEGFV